MADPLFPEGLTVGDAVTTTWKRWWSGIRSGGVLILDVYGPDAATAEARARRIVAALEYIADEGPECLPGCDPASHEALCPVASPGDAYRAAVARVADLEATCRRLVEDRQEAEARAGRERALREATEQEQPEARRREWGIMLAVYSNLAGKHRERADGLLAFLARTGSKGGCIVSSADCSAAEIVDARANGRMIVTEDGSGYVHRLHRWLARVGTDGERPCPEGADWIE